MYTFRQLRRIILLKTRNDYIFKITIVFGGIIIIVIYSHQTSLKQNTSDID